jgi:hypothetical protein
VNFARAAWVAAVAGLQFPFPLGAETAKDRAIQLPPFFVHDSRFGLPLWTWGYMSFPGYEVLTGCSRGVTNEFVMGAARQLSILHQIAPAAFEAPASVPTSLILMNWNQAQAVTDDMKRFMAARPADVNIGSSDLNEHIIYFPQLRLHDTESTDINLILGDPRSSDAVILQPGYVQYLMETRIPHLPGWYVAAVTDLYRNAVFGSSGVSADTVGRLTLGSTSVTFSPVSWISETESAALLRDPDLRRSLLPIEKILFGRPLPSGGDEQTAAYRRLWQAESDLLLQWVITDKHGARIAALKRFIDNGDNGRRDEPVFKECFGLGFEEIRDELADSLPAAMEKSITWFSDSGGVDEVFRDATPAETARILGNWELMEIPFVRAQEPEMVFPYMDQAEHTLGDAYKKGLRDPGFLAVLSLYESEGKDAGKALPFLEAAAAQGAAYPRAYTETARIRLKEALARPKGTVGKLGTEQIASVIAPLRAALRLRPPQKATYLLFALALENGEAAPSPGDLQVLNEGLRYFPEESELATMVAALNDRHGANGIPAGKKAR